MTTTDELAEIAYEAGMALRMDATMTYPPWDQLPEYWKRIYRAQAEAIAARLTQDTLFGGVA